MRRRGVGESNGKVAGSTGADLQGHAPQDWAIPRMRSVFSSLSRSFSISCEWRGNCDRLAVMQVLRDALEWSQKNRIVPGHGRLEHTGQEEIVVWILLVVFGVVTVTAFYLLWLKAGGN